MKRLLVVILTLTFVTLICKAQSNEELRQRAKNVEGLSKLWSEAKYNFVGIDELGLNLDSLYLAFLPSVMETKDTLVYYNILKNFVSYLGDGHSKVYYPKNLVNKYYARPPLRTRLIENKVIVTHADSQLLLDNSIDVGQELLSINGMEVHTYVEHYVKPILTASTPQGFENKAYGDNLLRGNLEKELNLELKKPNGTTFMAKVHRLPGLKAEKLPNIVLKMTGRDGAILSINSFNDNRFWTQFDSLYQVFVNTSWLIIDIRNNKGGNSNQGFYILQHLSDKNFKTTLWKTRQSISMYNTSGLMNFWQVKEADDYIPIQNKPIYKGKVALLIGPSTASAAEDFAVAFDHMERGLIIGEPSSGTSGESQRIALPYGGYAKICVKRDYYPNGKGFNGIGVQPDITIFSDVKSFRHSIDQPLQEAIKVLDKSGNKTDL